MVAIFVKPDLDVAVDHDGIVLQPPHALALALVFDLGVPVLAFVPRICAVTVAATACYAPREAYGLGGQRGREVERSGCRGNDPTAFAPMGLDRRFIPALVAHFSAATVGVRV